MIIISDTNLLELCKLGLVWPLENQNIFQSKQVNISFTINGPKTAIQTSLTILARILGSFI